MSHQEEPIQTEVARAIAAGGGPAKVARKLGVSTQTVCFYRDGKRKLRAEHGAAIELLAGGAVTRQQLWPTSWPQIWPELTDAPAGQGVPHG